MFTDNIRNYFQQLRETLERTERDHGKDIAHGARLLIDTLGCGGKVLIMGNGGSAADAEHFAAELVGRFLKNRRGLPALAMSCNSSASTAIANDYGFDRLFSRQIEALSTPGDLVIALSTSGNSANICRGLATAVQCGCKTLALLGRDGGKAANMAEFEITVAAQQTSHIQEMHITIIHLLCKLTEEALFPSEVEK